MIRRKDRYYLSLIKTELVIDYGLLLFGSIGHDALLYLINFYFIYLAYASLHGVLGLSLIHI